MATVILRETLPDGTIKVWWDDGQTRIFGTPKDPVAAATQAGQVSAAQTRAVYSDPWYVENVLNPMNRATEQAAQDRAAQLEQAAKRLEMEGRTAEANILYNKAQIELRKDELRQSGYLTERGQDIQMRGQNLQAAGMMANLRGFGNAAQALDFGRRTEGFGTQTGAMADIAAGRMPQGAFGFKPGQNPISMQDRMSGMLGAPSQSAMDVRDANDKNLARQIASGAGQLQRGSFESMAPEELEYTGSYVDSIGDWNSTQNRYRAAGIMQGRRRY